MYIEVHSLKKAGNGLNLGVTKIHANFYFLFQLAIGRLFGTIPGAPVFGAIFDNACLQFSNDGGEEKKLERNE